MNIVKTEEVEFAKRVNIPFRFEINCSKCNRKLEQDYSNENYLSYPQSNSVQEAYFYCPDCETEEFKSFLFIVDVKEIK